MKKFKKILALALAAVMVLAMSTTAFADQTEGTTASIQITTDETLEGTNANTYKAYKIFDATYDTLSGTNTQSAKDPTYTPANAPVAYFMATGNPWISTVQGMTAYFTVKAAADGTGYTVELKDGVDNTAATAKAIATALKAALSSLTLTGDYAGIEITAGGAAVSVQPGYYLIASDTATNLQLVTTDVTIVEKNEYIYDDKVAETASLTIGESATYYIKVYLPANIDTTKPVVVHDTLAEQLSFNNDVKVAILDADPGTTVAEYKAVEDSAYEATLPTAFVVGAGDEDTNPCTFHITLTTTNYTGKYLLFKYTAELLATADADGDGYVNKEFTTYADYKTVPSEPKVKTYDFDIKKVDSSGTELSGAKFELYGTWDTTNDKPVANSIYSFFAVTGGYKKTDNSATTTVDATAVTTLEAGTINVAGLGAGTYYLVETEPPTGFNKLEKPVVINITDEGVITASYNGEAISGVSDLFQIENNAGTVLPSTGGMGTTVLYVVGGLVVAAAIVLLITKRRMRKEEY